MNLKNNSKLSTNATAKITEDRMKKEKYWMFTIKAREIYTSEEIIETKISLQHPFETWLRWCEREGDEFEDYSTCIMFSTEISKEQYLKHEKMLGNGDLYGDNKA